MLSTCLIVLATASIGQTTSLTHDSTVSDGLQFPARLAPTASGGFYVTDPPNKEVLEYDSAGVLVATYALSQGPMGIAVHPGNGNILVSGLNGTVTIYNSSFASQGTLNPAPLTFDAPNDIAVHPDTGEVYVVDSCAHKVLVFDGTTGLLVRSWGTVGWNLGQFGTPQAIAIDAARGHILVSDTDNFRVQVFNTAGLLQFKFGYRILYSGSTSTAWFARSEGLAVDACGNIYVTDALMGTVRAFSPTGRELSATFAPLVNYGTAAGQVRIPCDVMIDGTDLFVASTNNSAVEQYTLACTTLREAPMVQDGDEGVGLLSEDAVVVEMADAEPGIRATYPYPMQPPHMIDGPNVCNRCHNFNGSPGGMLTAAGQENLCVSCHTAAGPALRAPIGGTQHLESHPWGVPASNPPAVPGPAAGSELALHLDNGNVRCGTCHNPHESVYGEDAPYLRGGVLDGSLCAQCHTQVAEWQFAGHSDESADPWGHYDWTQANRAACRRCHSGYGYIDYSNGVPAAQQRGNFRVADCTVCHATHGKSQDADLLRIFDTVTLPAPGADVTLTDVGPMATCMACHNGRTAPDDPGLTPHYALGGVILEGLNGISFGNTLLNSPHKDLANCVDCHMSPTPSTGQPGAGKIGGHSFNMKVNDSADPDFGVENLSGCNSVACHGSPVRSPELLITTLNRTALGDYDGDGTIEGVQDETRGMSALVLAQIEAKGAVKLPAYPYWSTAAVAPADLALVQDAIWNWQLVENSGDHGVHNTAYTTGVLQVTYKALTGVDIPNAFLRYSTPVTVLSDTHVEILSVNGGAPVQPGGAFTVNFTVEDDAGVAIPKASLNRLRIYVSGPSTHYQRVAPQDSNLANFVQNPDGSFTYTRPTAFPTVFAAPLNDSTAFGAADGELTGQALLDGTYTVLIESRRAFGTTQKAGDATRDFIIDADGVSPPALAPRQVVRREVCNDCHNDLVIHGGGRFAVTGCVVCHNAGAEDSITSPASTPGLTINFDDMIHRLHSGHLLPRAEATANGIDPYRYIISGFGGNPIDFTDVGFPIIPMATLDCAACHDGAAQAGQIYTTTTRANCGACHDDIDFVAGTILDQANASVSGGLLTQADLTDPAYRTNPGGIAHVFADDNLCSACHGPSAPWDVEPLHQHPTDPAQEGLAPAIDVVAVTGMTGGGGTYFQAGDRPQIKFKLSNSTADPLQLVPGNRSVADRIEFIFGGPTTLYQTIITAQRPWNNGNLATAAANWVDNFGVDGTYTYIAPAIPVNYPAQLNSIGDPPGDQIFPFEEGWGQQYSAAGTPLDAGTYTVFGYGRRVTPVAGEREPTFSDTFDVPFGAAGAIVPYADTVITASCNACHGNLAFHGNAREGVKTCLACHTAGTQDGGTDESVDFRIMIHKLHNARELTQLPYELNGNGGIADFSHLLISALPGGAAECQVCHTTDAWKSPPVRDNMRTWKVACTSCHDSPETAAHAEASGDAETFVESCATCHGDGTPWSVERVHKSP